MRRESLCTYTCMLLSGHGGSVYGHDVQLPAGLYLTSNGVSLVCPGSSYVLRSRFTFSSFTAALLALCGSVFSALAFGICYAVYSRDLGRQEHRPMVQAAPVEDLRVLLQSCSLSLESLQLRPTYAIGDSNPLVPALCAAYRYAQ